jgi:uncharacterized protein (TIGR02588 family)
MAVKTSSQANRPAHALPAKDQEGGKPHNKDGNETQSFEEKRLEWIVATLSAAVTLALAGFILYEALTKTGEAPDISFVASKAVAMTQGVVIEVEVHNDGHVTVADVEMEARADFGGGEEEIGTVTLNYLPAESISEIGFGFSREVDPQQVSFRVLGYTYP